ncbi:flavin reductase (DIM6/NTAB) family NADH-FMN oxidoreductase RutF [Sporomusaceae bacterium BoRhaA]|uniref:flavin reductase family protein n=1 Tax=Pelorhabdus rhamnosifermentans TaxID=2772457 RepID=UPI001C06320F|nr:flavin reductase family protein [Pelorhabdus rhamnosifermentans]MBU2700405.1 flavin reductase (DIM6/NTAB) family NADH-FMN oxidoreductase RutF [Pelorhabdus rhamnosifermentans]
MKKSLGAKTFAMPAPVWVVGTYGENGEPNIMTAAWGGICCSVPPCVAVSLQKPRASYANILAHKAFTINIPSAAHLTETDYVGIISGKNEDKFSAVKLTPVKSDIVDAPYVKEFPLVLECKLLQVVEIGLHTQFIGEIIDVKAEENVLGEKGLPILERVNPFLFSPSEGKYYAVGQFLEQSFSSGSKFKK